MRLRNSTMDQEGALKVSSFIKIPLLIDDFEMENLCQFFGDISFYNTQGVSDFTHGILKAPEFMEHYRSYINALKENKIIALKKSYPIFSYALSVTPDIFYEVKVDETRRVIKATKPPIQMQPHEFFFSQESETFYSMVFSEKSISYGIQFSYPNLYQNPHTHEVYNVDETFPNTSFFKNFRQWVRNNTVPSSFVVNGKKYNLPYRVGKGCFSWLSKHPQLLENQIFVKTPSSIS